MARRYDSINRDDPHTAAEIVGRVEKTNYLAHSIRETELILLERFGMHYHIVTYASESKCAKTYFVHKACIIRLPENLCENELGDNRDRRLRLVLAHELGHLIYNINDLENSTLKLQNRTVSPEEEIYAWTFAYCLVDKKSDYHKDVRRKNEFIYEHGELKNSLTNILDKQVEAAKNDNLRKEKEYVRDATLKNVSALIASKAVNSTKDS
jgi:hypothetical protein